MFKSITSEYVIKYSFFIVLYNKEAKKFQVI